MQNKLLIMISIILFLFGFVFIKHSKGYRENFGGFKEYHMGPKLSQMMKKVKNVIKRDSDDSDDSDDGEGTTNDSKVSDNGEGTTNDSKVSDNGEESDDGEGTAIREGFLNFNKLHKGTDNCPNEIIQKEDGIYLYNTNKLEKPGINPIIFQKLEEYLNYVRMLRSKNIKCPILYYKETYTTQNEKKYKLIPELSTALPQQPITKLYDANRSPNSIFNQNLYPGFDPQDQYIGLNTPLDQIFHEKEKISDNPMDANWGGRGFTNAAIRSGKFKGNEVIMEVA